MRWLPIFALCVLSALRLHAQAPAVVANSTIRDAPPDEWLTYGRDYAETHFSPLRAITRENVTKLRLAWAADFVNLPGQVEATPLVSNGVLYAAGAWSAVFAVDARTGTLKWRWDPALVREGLAAGGPAACCGPVNRGVALYRGKDTVPGDPSKPFESPAMERAAATWKGEWWKHGGGGTVWDSMAYDPEADLLYLGVGNGGPWNRDFRSPGGGDNLFIACILALTPSTGELVWYYQTTPGDEWDYTATQTIILTDLLLGGRTRKVLIQAPKNGFFYVLDRLTGELLSAEPFVPTTWATAIDKKSGRPVETATARYTEVGALISPASGGANNWQPMAWDPQAHLAFMSGRLNTQFFQKAPTFDPKPGQYNIGLVTQSANQPAPPRPSGFLLAWDPVQQRERWRVAIPTPINGGVLATGGGLVFHGTVDGTVRAYRTDTGTMLWEAKTAAGPATPITYEIDGRQFISIVAGRAGDARVWTFSLGEHAQ